MAIDRFKVHHDGPKPHCYDCGLPYADPAFQDLIIEDKAWEIIKPSPHPGAGLLCPNCICARLEEHGLRHVHGRFTSGALAW